MRRVRLAGWWVLCVGALLACMPRALAAPEDDLMKQADEAMNKADFATAIKALTDVTTKYTASLQINQAKYKLAYAYFLKGEHDNAIKILAPMADPKFPAAEVREVAHLLLGQSYSAAADAIKEDPKKKDPLLDSAIKTFTSFLNAYLKSDQRDAAMLGLAVVEMNRGSHDDAIKHIDQFQQQFPNSPFMSDAQFLRPTILGAKAAALLKSGVKEQGVKTRDQARTIFTQLLTTSADLALGNNAAFAAAQLWFDADNFDDAITFYRYVRPKADIAASQEAKVKALEDQKGQIVARAGAMGMNAPVVQRFFQRLQQEKGKLDAIKSGPDFYVSAAIRIAVCYMKQEKWDEAFVMCRHLLQNLQGDANKQERKIVLDAMFSVQIGLRNADDAKKFDDDFQAQFPKDEMAQNHGIYLAKLYWLKDRPDEALRTIDKMAADYPKGESTEEAVVTKATIFLTKEQPQQALDQLNLYLKQYPPGKGKFVPESEYHRAQVDQQLGNLEKALKEFQEVRTKYGDAQFIDDAFLQVGITLVMLSKWDEAITDLTQFKERFATSERMALALLQLGDAHVGKLKIAVGKNDAKSIAESLPSAASAYKDVLGRWPNDAQNAPMAQYRLGLAYFYAKQYANMATEFDKLAKNFPNSPLQADAHFWLGYNFGIQTNWSAAAEQYGIVIKDYPKSTVAPDSSLRLGQAWTSAAFALGRSRALMPPEKARKWDELTGKAMEAYEHTMATYSQTSASPTAVNEILGILTIRLRGKLIDAAGVDGYFLKLLEGPAGKDTTLKVNALFALGNLQYASGDAKRALATFERAIKEGPNVELDPRAYEAFAKALIDNGKFDDAVRAYQKMADVAKKAEEWPTWADAAYGIGDAYFLKKDYANARTQFSLFSDLADKVREGKVKTETLNFEQRALATSKKLPDAQLGMANILLQEGKFDDALKKFTEYIEKSRGVNKPRARAVMGLGHSLMGRAAKAGAPDAATADYQAAFANFSKVADFYGAFDDIVAEAMFMAGQALEKLNRYDDARKNYEDLIKKYPDDPNTKKAKDALQKLPPPTPPGQKK